jgi:hypothetical protein
MSWTPHVPSVESVRVGAKAPSFKLSAAVSGRVVEPTKGRKMVLVFHGPQTTDAPKEVGKAVRAVYPKAEDVVIANIVDLRSMGGLWRKVADASIKANYDRMAPKVSGDPAEYVIICPDYDGTCASLFGLDDPNREPAVAVLDGKGHLLGLEVGGELAQRALALLQT